MGYVLFESGKKIGEVEDWNLIQRPAEVKNVLGKEFISRKPYDECTFISPKPIHRKGKFTVVQDKKTEYVLQPTSIKDGTVVIATVLEKNSI